MLHEITFSEGDENGKMTEVTRELYKTEPEARQRFTKAIAVSFNSINAVKIHWDEILPKNGSIIKGTFMYNPTDY